MTASGKTSVGWRLFAGLLDASRQVGGQARSSHPSPEPSNKRIWLCPCPGCRDHHWADHDCVAAA